MLKLFRVSLLLSLLLVSASPIHAAKPKAVAIALKRTELPPQVLLAGQFTKYYSPRQLNGDVVPFGLTVRQLRAAGIKGLYTQGLVRPYDTNLYSWQYLALASPDAAHRTYQHWARAFKYPFTAAAGKAAVGNEGRYYRIVAMSHDHMGLLVRSGSYVILGHYNDRGTLTRLMKLVVHRSRNLGS